MEHCIKSQNQSRKRFELRTMIFTKSHTQKESAKKKVLRPNTKKNIRHIKIEYWMTQLRYESSTLILFFKVCPPHSVLYWPSTQPHHLVTHSWANWIYFDVLKAFIMSFCLKVHLESFTLNILKKKAKDRKNHECQTFTVN